MSVQYSTALRNAMGDAWSTAIGASAKVRIWTGAMPANCAAADAGTKLAEFALASTWTAAAAGGVKTLSNLPLSTNAVNTGTAGYYRIYDSTGTTCHEQGLVGTAGADMTIDNASIASAQQVQITAYSKTWPGA